jgi:hypothetical protein
MPLVIPHHAAFRPASEEFLMRTMVLAAMGVLVLSAGAASAQGGAGASPSVYGQQWAEIHRAKCQHAK